MGQESGPDGIELVGFDESRLKRSVMMRGGVKVKTDWPIHEPACDAGWIEWDHETEAPWTFMHTEVQYVVSGEAEYIYTSFPDHMVERKKILRPGDICLLRFGTAIKVRPIKKPFRVMFVLMPAPEIPYELDLPDVPFEEAA